MRFASTAWRLAGWRLPHSRHPHRCHQLTADRSRAAGGLTLVTPEGSIVGCELLTSSDLAALCTEMKALKASSSSCSNSACRLRPGHELPRRRPSRHRQQPRLRHRIRRSHGWVHGDVEPQPSPGVLLRVVLVRKAILLNDPQWSGSRGALCALAPTPTRWLPHPATVQGDEIVRPAHFGCRALSGITDLPCSAPGTSSESAAAQAH